MLSFPKASTLNVNPVNQKLLYYTGLAFMLMNKMRRTIKRYSNPRPFSSNDIERNIKYVLNVVDNWEKIAKIYTRKENPFLNASILELGPGPDLGTGFILLSLGAKSYRAIDMFPLALDTPAEFYEGLLDAIATKPLAKRAHKAYSEFSQKGFADNFHYQQVQYPTLEQLPLSEFDIILSQAVWEHIVDPETALLNLIKSAKKAAIIINEVDLSSHTRFIRDIDPLNLLRFGNSTYDILSFPGTPNRLRGSDYLQLSNKIGLQNTHIVPIKIVNDEYANSIRPVLPATFQKKEPQDLAMLSCWWLATLRD